jgi:hypothetical protein
MAIMIRRFVTPRTKPDFRENYYHSLGLEHLDLCTDYEGGMQHIMRTNSGVVNHLNLADMIVNHVEKHNMAQTYEKAECIYDEKSYPFPSCNAWVPAPSAPLTVRRCGCALCPASSSTS